MKRFFMPTRTTLLIIGLTLFTTALVVYSLILDAQKPTAVTVTTTPTPVITPTIEKTAKITFDPPVYQIERIASASGTVNLVLDTGNHEISEIQIEMSYDPEIFTSLNFATPSSTLWNENDTEYSEIIKEIDQEQGRISYIVGVPNDAQPVIGSGAIIALNFRVNTLQLTTTDIRILEKTVVMQPNSNESVLNSTGNFMITNVLPTPRSSTPSAALETSPTPAP